MHGLCIYKNTWWFVSSNLQIFWYFFQIDTRIHGGCQSPFSSCTGKRETERDWLALKTVKYYVFLCVFLSLCMCVRVFVCSYFCFSRSLSVFLNVFVYVCVHVCPCLCDSIHHTHPMAHFLSSPVPLFLCVALSVCDSVFLSLYPSSIPINVRLCMSFFLDATSCEWTHLCVCVCAKSDYWAMFQ